MPPLELTHSLSIQPRRGRNGRRDPVLGFEFPRPRTRHARSTTFCRELSFEEGSPVVPVVVTDCRRCRLTEGLQSAFYGFTRAFGQVFGIAIGSTILQNRLNELLPAAFLERFGSGEIAFAAIPVIKTL